MFHQSTDARRPRSRTRGRHLVPGLRSILALGLVLAVIAGALVAPMRVARAQSDPVIPSLGTAVPFIGDEGSTLAELTVVEVVDPLTDYDPFAVPPRSYHFVLLTLTVENTGNRPFTFDPNGIALQDAEGFLARPAYVARTEAAVAALPDFAAGDIAPGDSVTGAIAFQTLNDVALQSVAYIPTGDRLVLLADLGGAASSAPTTASDDDTNTASTSTSDADDTDESTSDTPDDAAASGGPSDDTDAEDTEDTENTNDAASGGPSDDTDAQDADETDADADADADADTAAVDCDAVETWAVDTGERLDTIALLVTELQTFDRETADPTRLAEISDEFAVLADEQLNGDTPPALQEANDLFVDAFDTFSDLFAQVADAAEAGDLDAVADSLAQDITDANAVMAQAGELAQTELASCGLS